MHCELGAERNWHLCQPTIKCTCIAGIVRHAWSALQGASSVQSKFCIFAGFSIQRSTSVTVECDGSIRCNGHHEVILHQPSIRAKTSGAVGWIASQRTSRAGLGLLAKTGDGIR